MGNHPVRANAYSPVGSATAHTRVSEGHPNKPGREHPLELKSMNLAAAGDAVGVLLCRDAGVPGRQVPVSNLSNHV